MSLFQFNVVQKYTLSFKNYYFSKRKKGQYSDEYIKQYNKITVKYAVMIHQGFKKRFCEET